MTFFSLQWLRSLLPYPAYDVPDKAQAFLAHVYLESSDTRHCCSFIGANTVPYKLVLVIASFMPSQQLNGLFPFFVKIWLKYNSICQIHLSKRNISKLRLAGVGLYFFSY